MSFSSQDTLGIGSIFSKTICPGDVVLLEGPLGVGKTVFVKGALGGLGFSERDIISPSFALVREYRKKRFPIHHIDLYRIEAREELCNLGYQDYFYPLDGISFIEWGRKIEDMLPRYIRIDFSFQGMTQRCLDFSFKNYPASRTAVLRKKMKSQKPKRV